jgi:hypothetical protein
MASLPTHQHALEKGLGIMMHDMRMEVKGIDASIQLSKITSWICLSIPATLSLVQRSSFADTYIAEHLSNRPLRPCSSTEVETDADLASVIGVAPHNLDGWPGRHLVPGSLRCSLGLLSSPSATVGGLGRIHVLRLPLKPGVSYPQHVFDRGGRHRGRGRATCWFASDLLSFPMGLSPDLLAVHSG